MFIVYDLIFFVFCVMYFPYLWIRRKWHPDFWKRFGSSLENAVPVLDPKSSIWIHAVSVGEVLAVAQLVKNLKIIYKEAPFIVSVVTKTGYRLANERLNQEARVIYAPVDFSWVVARFIRRINPKIYICAETEIWPNLYNFLAARGIPIVIVNGRISDKGFRGYKKIWWLTKNVFAKVAAFCMQTEADAEKAISLGADYNKVRIMGNIKFDMITHQEHLPRESLNIDMNSKILIAGSTHPGEEEIILGVYQKLKSVHPHLRLIIAPRHVERTDDVEAIIQARGLKAVRYTKLATANTQDQDVILVDTIGHLRFLYSCADLVFIGKTLCIGGGQNILEPAFFAKPIFVGPMTENFRDIVNLFKKENALVQVTDQSELYSEMEKIIQDPSLGKKIGSKAKILIELHQGATARTVTFLKEIIEYQK